MYDRIHVLPVLVPPINRFVIQTSFGIPSFVENGACALMEGGEGEWSQWGAWSCVCPITTRKRSCVNPSTQVPATDCTRPQAESRPSCELAVKLPDCSQPLGVQDGSIPNKHIIASSQYSNSRCPSYFARLHRQRQSSLDSSWCARYKKVGEFVQVNLGSIKTVTKVATQGREVSASYKAYNQFVTMYALSYSNDQTTWTDYVGDDSCIKRFIANTDTTSVVTNELPLPIKAQYIRVVVYSWNRHISMRLELYGC
ncbi:hypothetical protein QZH41_010793 [Actinostola sp. cb2023]|nr:hypothetical protein QZH41_010793 [Actinostola sp. cb2023]